MHLVPAVSKAKHGLSRLSAVGNTPKQQAVGQLRFPKLKLRAER